ncbi:conserved hypothetical protein [Ricinus communis]|uniref:Uncharacterized protein n=1 Tax=Ricinus communis TaxID=3988 RepID=B9SVZ6_RICCO|nr:conserved hypothetical protein [Ricinus communis]
MEFQMHIILAEGCSIWHDSYGACKALSSQHAFGRPRYCIPGKFQLLFFCWMQNKSKYRHTSNVIPIFNCKSSGQPLQFIRS